MQLSASDLNLALSQRGFRYQNHKLTFEGCDLSDIAHEGQTPIWVISGDILRQRAEHFCQMMAQAAPEATCHFAMKSLDHLAVLKIIEKTGMGLDIVSGGELTRAMHIGFDPQKIVFSGVGKTDSELRLALTSGVGQINVETIGELERLNQIALEKNAIAPVAIRINPELGYGGCDKITTGNKSDKFGIPRSEISDLWPRIQQEMKHIHLQGIAVHSGSQILEVENFRSFYTHIARLVRKWQQEGIKIESLDCGGGFGIPYQLGDKELSLGDLSDIIREILVPLGVKLRFEPGRYISGPSGILLSRITEIKKTDSHQFLILDAGMNDLIRPALYQAAHEILPLTEKSPDTPNEIYDIAGPICESSDFFRRSYQMPRLKRGDLVAILDTGAYGSVMSTTYNSHPLAPIVLTSQGKWDIIRKRQTMFDILESEIIPKFL